MIMNWLKINIVRILILFIGIAGFVLVGLGSNWMVALGLLLVLFYNNFEQGNVLVEVIKQAENPFDHGLRRAEELRSIAKEYNVVIMAAEQGANHED